jgi:hypothetical protein
MSATPIDSSSRPDRRSRPRARSRPAVGRVVDARHGHEALIVNGGGFDGGSGTFFANAGDDVHAVGKLDPLVPGHVGCIVIRPDGSRYLARAVPDPLAGHKPD